MTRWKWKRKRYRRNTCAIKCAYYLKNIFENQSIILICWKTVIVCVMRHDIESFIIPNFHGRRYNISDFSLIQHQKYLSNFLIYNVTHIENIIGLVKPEYIICNIFRYINLLFLPGPRSPPMQHLRYLFWPMAIR